MDEEKDLFQRLVNRIKENKLDVDINKIQQAYILANESHIGQKRKSGEDYIKISSKLFIMSVNSIPVLT